MRFRFLASGRTASSRSGLERFHLFDVARSVAVAFDRHSFDPLADQRFNVQCAFGPLEFFWGGVQRGVARQEDGAAIVERFSGMRMASPTAAMLWSVCEATWPRLSPVMRPSERPERAIRSAMRSIMRRYSKMRNSSGALATISRWTGSNGTR